MEPINIPGKPYKPYVRAFFSVLRQIAKGKTESVSVRDLAGSLPLRFKTPQDRTRLENRKDIKLSGDKQSLVSGPVSFSTLVNFIQENFPPDNRNQDIRATIPKNVAASFFVTDSSFELKFSGDQRTFVDFPGHPTLSGQFLTRVLYTNDLVRIEFESLAVLVDLTTDPPSFRSGASFATLGSQEATTIMLVTILDLATRSTRKTIRGFYKIQCAHIENTNCDPGDSQCVSSRCNVETRYEGDSIEVPDNASDDEIKRRIDQACQAKRSEVSGNCNELSVTWTSSGGPSITTVSENTGSCLGVSAPVPPGGCAVVTAVDGNLDVLDVFYSFRDDFLSRTRYGRLLIRSYYTVSPLVHRVCRRSPILRSAYRYLCLVGFFVLRPFFGAPASSSHINCTGLR